MLIWGDKPAGKHIAVVWKFWGNSACDKLYHHLPQCNFGLYAKVGRTHMCMSVSVQLVHSYRYSLKTCLCLRVENRTSVLHVSMSFMGLTGWGGAGWGNNVHLHCLTYMMLRCCTSFCTSSHAWCYAAVRLLARPHIHDATLLYVVLHFLTYMMLR